MSIQKAHTRRRGLHDNVVLVSKITMAIGITMVLIGIAHDFAVVPSLGVSFMWLRIIVAALGCVALLGMFTEWGGSNVKKLTFGWVFFPQIMLAYMVSQTGGFASTHARGFIFVLIASTLFPILNFRQSKAVVLGTLVLYLASATYGSHGTLIYGDAFGASMHITTVMIVCGIARLFLERTFVALSNYETQLKSTLYVVETKLDELAHQKAVAVHQDKMTSLGNVIASILASVNHPLNNALWAVDSTLRGPLVQQQSPKLVEGLVDVKKALSSIKTTMASLRPFAAPKGMDVSHDAVECDFRELVESAIKLLGKDLSGIQLNIKVSPGLTVHCDRTAILSVLMGLFSNARVALVAKNSADPVITVYASVSGNQVRVDIHDNGCGIPDSIVTSIFDPFFTTDTSGKKLGLGLSIAYGEIARHGGTLTANSTPGEGTTIRFELPMTGYQVIVSQDAA